jgi:hypothetical protein
MNEPIAKPIVAVLTGDEKLRDEVIRRLEADLGTTDFIGQWHQFGHTKYYETEMGDGLKRCFISFEKLISPHQIGRLKVITQKIEDQLRIGGKRRVNLDPGYVDLFKVVLSSGKGGGHMVMIGDASFVDVLLWYNKGWQPLPWTYPDFREGIYFKDLETIRLRLKEQIHHSAAGARNIPAPKR